MLVKGYKLDALRKEPILLNTPLIVRLFFNLFHVMNKSDDDDDDDDDNIIIIIVITTIMIRRYHIMRCHTLRNGMNIHNIHWNQ